MRTPAKYRPDLRSDLPDLAVEADRPGIDVESPVRRRSAGLEQKAPTKVAYSTAAESPNKKSRLRVETAFDNV